MLRRNVPIPSPNSVAAGQTATIDLPTDRRYHGLYLFYKKTADQATIEADITGVRLKVNGTVVRTFSAAQLNSINALNGKPFVNGLIPIRFSEPWRRTQNGEDLLAWGMSNIVTFQVEIDIADGAVAPTISGYAVVDRTQEPFVGIIAWRRQVVPVTAAGIRTVNDFPKRRNEAYNRMHCFENAPGDIIDVEVSVDDFKYYDLNAQENAVVLGERDMVPQAGVYHIVFDHDQRSDSLLPMVKANGTDLVSEFRIDFNMENAAQFTVIMETFAAVPQI